MSETLAIYVLVGAWLLEAIAKWVCIDRLVGLPHFAAPPDFSALKRRLRGYAEMKLECTANEARGGGLVSQAEHEILLGTLKKVEAKNAVLATFWSIAIAALVAFVMSADICVANVWGFVSVAIFVPFLTSILLCAGQVDQIHSNRILASSCDNTVVAKKMQEALMLDLLQKEAAFRFSWYGAMLAVLGAIVLSGGMVAVRSL